MVELWLGSHGREGQDGLKVPVRRILVRPDYQVPTCARYEKYNRNITNNFKDYTFYLAVVFGVQNGHFGHTES